MKLIVVSCVFQITISELQNLKMNVQPLMMNQKNY